MLHLIQRLKNLIMKSALTTKCIYCVNLITYYHYTMKQKDHKIYAFFTSNQGVSIVYTIGT